MRNSIKQKQKEFEKFITNVDVGDIVSITDSNHKHTQLKIIKETDDPYSWIVSNLDGSETCFTFHWSYDLSFSSRDLPKNDLEFFDKQATSLYRRQQLMSEYIESIYRENLQIDSLTAVCIDPTDETTVFMMKYKKWRPRVSFRGKLLCHTLYYMFQKDHETVETAIEELKENYDQY